MKFIMFMPYREVIEAIHYFAIACQNQLAVMKCETFHLFLQ